LALPDPRRIDVVLPLGSEDVELLPGGVAPEMTRPGAWLCISQACLPPIADPAELAKVLRR